MLPMQSNWLFHALVTTLLWGVWGAFAGLPSEHGFPDTLIYVVWALTMIPPAVIVLAHSGWRIERDRLCRDAKAVEPRQPRRTIVIDDAQCNAIDSERPQPRRRPGASASEARFDCG